MKKSIKNTFTNVFKKTVITMLVGAMALSSTIANVSAANPSERNQKVSQIVSEWNKSSYAVGFNNGYKSSWQCAAFSRYVFVSLYGHTDQLSNTNNIVTTKDVTTSAQALNFIKTTAAPGDAVRVSKVYNGTASETVTHIVHLMDVNTNGSLSVYESNFPKQTNNIARSYTYNSCNTFMSDSTSGYCSDSNKNGFTCRVTIIHSKNNTYRSSDLSINTGAQPSTSNNTQTPSITKPSITGISISDVSTNYAKYSFTVSNPSRVKITECGLQIKKSGTSNWTTKGDNLMNASHNRNASFNAWYEIGSGKEVNLALTPSTEYEIRAYLKYEGCTTPLYFGGACFYTKAAPVCNVTYSNMTCTYVSRSNAKLQGHIDNPSGSRFSKVGCYIWDNNGRLIANYSESCTLTSKSFNQYLNVNTEARVTLKSNTYYTYQFWAQTSNGTYYSGKASFKTN